MMWASIRPMKTAALVPELDVADLATSLAFYVQLLGWSVAYQRPEERFAYLERDGAQLMLQEATGPGRRFRTAPLAHPYGRGVNFQVEAHDTVAIHGRVLSAGGEIILPLEVRWYRRKDEEVGHRQFVVADPDGYLWRFFAPLAPSERDGSPMDKPGLQGG